MMVLKLLMNRNVRQSCPMCARKRFIRARLFVVGGLWDKGCVQGALKIDR
jgi:hypothetical protein